MIRRNQRIKLSIGEIWRKRGEEEEEEEVEELDEEEMEDGIQSVDNLSRILIGCCFCCCCLLLSAGLKQHNGELKGGAKASCSGRPWVSACLIQGFPDKSKGAGAPTSCVAVIPKLAMTVRAMIEMLRAGASLMPSIPLWLVASTTMASTAAYGVHHLRSRHLLRKNL